MSQTAISIIEQNDPHVVGEMFRTDEQAVVLLEAMGKFLAYSGLALSKEGGSTVLELMRSTYYLGYKRGQMDARMPEFVVAAEGG